MNIVKLQDDLKSVPDQSLVGYVQNPSGQVPSYLALSELQRRKKMREQAQGAQGQGQQPSVAEQLVAETQPQVPQGIAGIPVSNVGSEEAYAAGGIIAFEDGGEVPSYADGGSTRAYNEAARNSFLGRGLGALDESTQLAPTQGNMFKRMGEYIVDTVTGMKWIRNPYTGALVKASDVVETPNAGALVGQMPQTNVTGLLSGELPATRDSSLPAAMPQALPTQDTGSVATTSKAIGTSAPGAAPIRQPAGIEQLMFTPAKDRSGEFEYTQAVDPRAAMEQYRGLIGTDPFQAKAAEKIAGMEKANAEYGKQMPWMSLAEAGLAMAAGKSPNALSNIAEGGMKGVAAFKAGQDKLRETEDKIFNAQAKVAEAQRAEDMAAAKYGIDSEQTAKAAKQREKAQIFEYKAKLEADTAAKTFEANKFNREDALKRQELADQKSYRAQSLKIQKDQAAKLSDYETFLELSKEDPANYKEVKSNGKTKQIFDIAKVSNEYKSYGKTSSSGVDEDTIVRAYAKASADAQLTGEPMPSYATYKSQFLGTMEGGAPTGPRKKPLADFG